MDSLTGLLNEGDSMAKLGSLFDGDADDAATAVDAAGPALIAGLADEGSADGGGAVLTEQLDAADTSILDDVDGFLDAGDTEAGAGILDSVFGEGREDVLDGLASESGLSTDAFTKVLPMLAPLVTGTLAKLRTDDDLDTDGVVGLLSTEKESLESDGKLGGWFGKLAAGGALGAAGASAAGLAGKLGDNGDTASDAGDAGEDAASDAGDAGEDAASDAGDAGEDAASDAGDAGEDAVSDAEDAAEDAASDAGDATKAAASDAGDAASDAKDAAEDKASDTATGAKAGTAGATTKLADIKDDDRDRRGGLGWLWWALGAVLIVLLLAWLLNQLGSDDSTSTGGSDTTTSPEEDTTTSAGEETTTSESEGTTTSESEETTTTVEETTTSDGGAGGELQAAVDSALADAGISGVTATIDGDVVTLTGEVESEDAKAAAQAATEAVEGVGSVDNQLTVGEGDGEAAADSDGESDSGSAGAGAAADDDTLNAELGLEPITFEYRSAVIAPAGAAVLDEVVAYLEENGDVNVEIQGHTDSDGGEAENLDLSTRRAESVKVYLEGAGIDGARMTTVGYGESAPKVPNDSADNKAMNRRIEFVVVS